MTELTQDSRAYTLVIADRAGREELMRALGEPLAQEKDSAEVEKPRESRIVLKQQLSFYLLAGAVVAAALLFCLSH
ncbi:MAG TPA: hypothetical protein VE621_23615 [Bryobacteraceae bacterium]|nr:hypothetical protein [Bryobacteraceae bacterium]